MLSHAVDVEIDYTEVFTTSIHTIHINDSKVDVAPPLDLQII